MACHPQLPAGALCTLRMLWLAPTGQPIGLSVPSSPELLDSFSIQGKHLSISLVQHPLLIIAQGNDRCGQTGRDKAMLCVRAS